MNKTSSLFFLVYILTISISYAQKYFSEGYAITIQGDTLKGELKDYTNKSVIFKDKTGTIITYTSNQLQSYSIAGVNRISALIKTKEAHYFIKERLVGYISLYELVDKEDEWVYIFKKGNEEYIPLIGKEAYSKWLIALSDNEDIALKRMLEARNFVYGYSYFVNIAKQYNKQTSRGKTQEITRKKDHSFEFFLGAARNDWYYTFHTNAFAVPSVTGPLSTYYFVPFGGAYTFQSRNRLSLTGELIYNQFYGERKYDVIGSETYHHILKVNQSYIKLSVLGRYVFMDGFFRTYLKAGPTFNRDIDFTIIEERLNNWVNDRGVKKFIGYGYTIGLGTEKLITPNKAIYAEARYFWHTVQDKVTHVGSTQSIQVLVGLSFKSRKK